MAKWASSLPHLGLLPSFTGVWFKDLGLSHILYAKHELVVKCHVHAAEWSAVLCMLKWIGKACDTPSWHLQLAAPPSVACDPSGMGLSQTLHANSKPVATMASCAMHDVLCMLMCMSTANWGSF